MILTMNNFTFNDSHYLQIHGTAMGTKMAPSFANLFLRLFEKNALRNAPFQPHTWLRYIDGNINTDLYTKPTDKHQHLLYSSCHPLHTEKAIPFSLALRLRRICSTDETFKIRTTELTTYLLKRGYKPDFVTKQIQRAADIPRIHTLQPKQINKPERIPFITTYNP